MRTVSDIFMDIQVLKQEIKYARAEGDTREAELLMQDLDDLQEELWNAKNK
jgi:hypothetical protein